MDKWMKNNNVVKILALAVSMLLWGMVHLEDVTQTPSATIDTKIIDNIKIQPFGLDESKYILTAMDTDNVRMEVRGKRTDITSIFSDEYKVKLDLSKVGPGTITLPLIAEHPSGVTVASMQPSIVTVIIEERDSASYPVTIVTKGTAAEGYQLGDMVIEPSTVQVTLPQSDLKNVSKVQGTIDLDGATDNVSEKKVKISAYNENGEVIEGAVIEPATVSVQIPVMPPSARVPIDLQYKGSLSNGLVLSGAVTDVKEVVLSGPKEALSGIKAYTDVVVDLSKIEQAGTTVLTVDLTPPDGFEKIEPSSVKVEVTAVSHGEKVIQDIPITLEQVGSDVRAVITQPANRTMSLTLTGAPELLNNLTKEDIRLVANVANLEPGSHEIPLEVDLPNFISRVDEGDPLTITVEVKSRPSASNVPSTTRPSDEPSTEPDTEPEEAPSSEEDSSSGQPNTEHEPNSPVQPEGNRAENETP